MDVKGNYKCKRFQENRDAIFLGILKKEKKNTTVKNECQEKVCLSGSKKRGIPFFRLFKRGNKKTLLSKMDVKKKYKC